MLRQSSNISDAVIRICCHPYSATMMAGVALGVVAELDYRRFSGYDERVSLGELTLISKFRNKYNYSGHFSTTIKTCQAHLSHMIVLIVTSACAFNNTDISSS